MALEYELFEALRARLVHETARLQAIAGRLALLDVLAGLAETAALNRYVRPIVDESGVILITDGRHPVVERLESLDGFVPNDTYLDLDKQRLVILTGPNMAGKSTYLRQVALITLLAQIGSFVPASSARLSVVDRVFTRVGASDDLAAGQSTFMVEMSEVAHILKNATPKSLVILDEIGRGTSTFDGMSIARAVVEYLVNNRKLRCKTLFATHYHELTRLAGRLDGLSLHHVRAREWKGDLVLLHEVAEGPADRSYGIAVARLAGLPPAVVSRARSVLAKLEAGRDATGGIAAGLDELPLFAAAEV